MRKLAMFGVHYKHLIWTATELKKLIVYSLVWFLQRHNYSFDIIHDGQPPVLQLFPTELYTIESFRLSRPAFDLPMWLISQIRLYFKTTKD